MDRLEYDNGEYESKRYFEHPAKSQFPIQSLLLTTKPDVTYADVTIVWDVLLKKQYGPKSGSAADRVNLGKEAEEYEKTDTHELSIDLFARFGLT